MNFVSRVLTRQLLNKSRFYRQLVVPSNQQHSHNEYSRETKKWNKFLIAGCCSGLTLMGYELIKNYLALPQVHAATIATESRRAKVRIIFPKKIRKSENLPFFSSTSLLTLLT